MPKTVSVQGLLLILLLLSLLAGTTQAAVTVEQRREIAALRVEIRKAEGLYKQGKFQECGELIRQIQERAGKLAEGAEKDVLAQLDPVLKSLKTAHALLELEGVQLPPLTIGESAPLPNSGDGISFSKQVAPILVAKCGRCHINSTRGMMSMASYEVLMRGTPDGAVVLAGDADGSRIIEVIESGDMPRGGLKVAPEELATLKQWIAAGAKYDAEDPKLNLMRLAPEARPAEAPMMEVVAATGNESVLFARDIAPVLVENCVGCHGRGQQAGNQFNMVTFQNLLRGGDSGPPIQPGNPDESLLIQKLKGTAGGERMPRGRPPLPDETIAKIATWIQEGAKFDGRNATQDIADVAAIDKARRSTHEELSAFRAELAQQNWRLGLPGIQPEQAETKSFRVVGNVDGTVLTQYAQQAERQAERVATALKVPANQPLIKGKMTLFAFTRRYDYGEFGRMVEQRDLPRGWRGHWRNTTIDAYVAFVVPETEDESLEPLFAQMIASSYVAGLGEVPRWFAEGTGRAVAARLHGSHPQVRAWNDYVPQVVMGMMQPDDFLAGRLGPEESDVASFGFVAFLMSDSRRFDRLLDLLREGRPFGESFGAVYGGSPEQVAAVWTKRALRRSR